MEKGFYHFLSLAIVNGLNVCIDLYIIILVFIDVYIERWQYRKPEKYVYYKIFWWYLLAVNLLQVSQKKKYKISLFYDVVELEKINFILLLQTDLKYIYSQKILSEYNMINILFLSFLDSFIVIFLHTVWYL